MTFSPFAQIYYTIKQILSKMIVKYVENEKIGVIQVAKLIQYIFNTQRILEKKISGQNIRKYEIDYNFQLVIQKKRPI